MIAHTEELWTELQTLVAQLGKDGGLISASIYDTAQLLRLYPPPEGVEPGLEWLIAQQQPDGGWGDPAVPTARDVSTLSAILTLHTYQHLHESTEQIQAGVDFLAGQAHQWENVHIDYFPIAVEMIFPYLLEEAAQHGLMIPREPYTRLFQLRQKKLDRLRQIELAPGTAPTHSWEALGQSADVALFDGSGGVGHSPAATAAWLHSTGDDVRHQAYIPIAERYLSDAAKATGVNVPGVVPNVWPIVGFELSYGLYALQIAGLIDNPKLSASVLQQSEALKQVLTKESGVAFGTFFVPDVDSTAAAVAVLQTLGYSVDLQSIWQFQLRDHFFTFAYEFNPSVFSNAHALYALHCCGQRRAKTEAFLLDRQLANGRWQADKWHSSWRYTTLEVILPLLGLGYTDQLHNTVDAFIDDQLQDGGWGMQNRSSIMETTYSVLALQAFNRHNLLTAEGKTALGRGAQWLVNNTNLDGLDNEKYWLGKELYSLYRVDRIYCLSTILSLTIELFEELSPSIQSRPYPLQ